MNCEKLRRSSPKEVGGIGGGEEVGGIGGGKNNLEWKKKEEKKKKSKSKSKGQICHSTVLKVLNYNLPQTRGPNLSFFKIRDTFCNFV